MSYNKPGYDKFSGYARIKIDKTEKENEQRSRESDKIYKEFVELKNKITSILENENKALTIQEISNKIGVANQSDVIDAIKKIGSKRIETIINPLDNNNSNSLTYKIISVNKAP